MQKQCGFQILKKSKILEILFVVIGALRAKLFRPNKKYVCLGQPYPT